MAYRMTELTPTCRVGLMSSGNLSIEVYSLPVTHPDSELTEVMVPADAVSELLDYLRRYA